ncbi:MAG TPA: hypothetical protein VNM92_11640 [Thermoanaerobaculia bacterium]|nr:hypothetical protein [Thermoanaerobaculia bacterium]
MIQSSGEAFGVRQPQLPLSVSHRDAVHMMHADRSRELDTKAAAAEPHSKASPARFAPAEA